MMLKRVVATGIAAVGLAVGGVVLASPGTAHASCVNADDAQGGGGGGWPGGGGFVDCHYAADGSYDHCVNVRVLGFGGWQCNGVGA